MLSNTTHTTEAITSVSSKTDFSLRDLVSFECVRELRKGCAASLVSVSSLSEQEAGSVEKPLKELLDFFRKMDSARFSQLFEWPAMIAWSRELFSAMQKHLADRSETTRKNVHELIHFGHAFLLDDALQGKADFEFSPALVLPLPFHIPNSDFVVSGLGIAEGQISVVRANKKGLTLQDGRTLTAELGLERASSLRYEGGQLLVLSPAAMVTPWATMPFAIPTLGLQGDYQARHVGLIQETLEVISRHAPTDYGILSRVMRVMGLKPVVPARTLNASYSEFPGACVLSVHHQPYEMASFLIHELYHSLLTCYEAKGAILPVEQLTEESAERCYSPWRSDMRPARGLLHALTVFDAVTEFWFDVLSSDVAEQTIHTYARDQIVRSLVQRNIGLASFRTLGRPTERGETLLQAICMGIDQHIATAKKLGLAADTPSLEVWPDGKIREETLVRDGPSLTLRESLFNHASKYDESSWSVPWMAGRQWLFGGFDRPGE